MCKLPRRAIVNRKYPSSDLFTALPTESHYLLYTFHLHQIPSAMVDLGISKTFEHIKCCAIHTQLDVILTGVVSAEGRPSRTQTR